MEVGSEMEKEHNIRLTSAELSSLWMTYLGDTMSICVFKYFLNKVDDTEIRPIIEHAMKISTEHVEIIKKIFSDEGIPIPRGFTDDDVNPDAPRLFQDTLFLTYIKYTAKSGLASYAAILPLTTRKDIREFYSSCLASTTELYNEATSLLLAKGLEVRPPYIPYPTEVKFVKKQSFLAGWFGEQRPLVGSEIMNLHANIQTNNLGEAISIAFGQVAKSKKVRDYMLRGKEIAKKHIEVFAKYLKAYDLPIPMSWNHEVENKTESPFSEKLMMYQISLMSASSIGNYGMAMSMSRRRDITADFARLSAEVALYAEDGVNIMIENEWMEFPPHAVDRVQLIKQ